MLKAYEVLLGQYKSHPIMGVYLEDDIPVFSYLRTVIDMLSSEERIMVKVALAIHEETQSASVRELLELSDLCFDKVVEALKIQRQQ